MAMKKLIIYFTAFAFLGFILVSASAFADKDPKKQKADKAKTQQCDKNKENITSTADAKACCHKEGEKGCCAKPCCDKSSEMASSQACNDTTSKASGEKACCNKSNGAACNKDCSKKSGEAACTKTCGQKSSGTSSAGCSKSASCEHKCNAAADAK
jgi:hypothetical protein